MASPHEDASASAAEDHAPAEAYEVFPPAKTAAAVAAAWLLPGLGHVILGRARRGLLFGALLLGFFGLGLAHDGRLALRDERQPFLTTLQVVANLGIGPLDLVARAKVYGRPAFRMQARPGDADVSEVFRDRIRSPVAIYGTAYIWTAGLMNLLLLFEVWDIGRGRKSGC